MAYRTAPYIDAFNQTDATLVSHLDTGKHRPPTLSLGKLLSLAAAALFALAPCQGQEACDPYNIPNEEPCTHNFGSPTGTSSSTPESRCWYITGAREGPNSYAPRFPLNLSMGFGLAMGDYPPLTLDATASTLPVVAQEATYHVRPAPRATRPTLNGVVDLITGVPLLQDSDFELPYGTATFRHLRSYSELPSVFNHENVGSGAAGDLGNLNPADYYWDWNGLGWMIAENPILLIDAAYEATVYPTATRHCYFIVDAHHAIPFTFIPSTGEYEAPPRFDAVLRHSGGAWSGTEWTTRPTEFRISLQHESITYVIHPIYEDMTADGAGSSFHAAPALGYQGQPTNSQIPWADSQHSYGPGIPFYGLVKRIEDRYGNIAAMEYCNVNLAGVPNPGECVQCYQQCYRKGRLSKVRLYAAGNTTPEWTILYIGRDFAPTIYNYAGWTSFPMITKEAIHSIYVYRGQGPEVSCPTIPYTTFATELGSPPHPVSEVYWPKDEIPIGLQRLDAIDAASIFSLPNDWVYRVKYLYAERCALFDSPAAYPMFGDGDNPAVANEFRYPRLIKATVHRNVIQETSPTTTFQEVLNRQTLYRYRTTGRFFAPQGGTMWDPVTLSAVWDTRAIDAIHQAAVQDGDYETLLENWPLGLLACRDDEEVPIRADNDSLSAGEIEERPLIDLASQSFRRWGNDYINDQGEVQNGVFGDYASFVANETATGDNFRHEMVNDYIDLDPAGIVSLRDGVFTFVDRSNGGGDGRVFKIYRFWNLESSIRPTLPSPAPQCGWRTLEQIAFGSSEGHAEFPYRALFRDPFRFHITLAGTLSPIPESTHVPLDKPFWVTVIDEYASLEDAKFPSGYDYSDLTTILTPLEGKRPPRSRRVVQVNVAGHVLADRHWNFATGQSNRSGMYEGYDYDTKGRIIEHRTYGWGVEKEMSGGHPDENGLINRWAYAPEVGVRNTYQASYAVGVQKGKPETTPDVGWVRQVIMHPDRPELPRFDFSFKSPMTGQLTWSTSGDPTTYYPTVADLTRYEYGFKGGDAAQNLIWKKVVGPPAKRSPTDSTLYYPFSAEVYNTKGSVICRAYGNVANPAQPGAGNDTLFIDVLTYDDQGRVTEEIIDAEAAPSGLALTLPRCSPKDPLEYSTQYHYSSSGQLATVRHPDGKYDFFVEKRVGENIEARKYSLVYVDSEGQMWAPLPGTVTRRSLEGISVGSVISAEWVNLGTISDPAHPEWIDFEANTFVSLSTLTPNYDSSGRPASMTVAGSDGASLTASIQYDYIGEITRQLDPDETITRTVHDPLGRLDRVFRGTKDKHPYWGGASTTDDNMILIEGRRYGEDTNNARLLKDVITFRNVDRDTAYDLDGIPTGGSIDRHWYDWRMRDVLVEHKDEGTSSAEGSPLSWTATYLDNLGRVRFSATFDSTGLAEAIDPTRYDFGASVPTASDIRSDANGHLLRLSETIYNSRGQVEEQRQYDVGTGAGQDPFKYLSTVTYYDHAGRPLSIKSPNGGVQTFEYDARGRQIESRLLAGSEEITKTVTEYDPNNNATTITTWERTHDGTGNTLSASNSVRTRMFNWYDDGNRLIATADLGANLGAAGSGDSFVNPSGTELARPGNKPKPVYNTFGTQVESVDLQGLPATAKVTCYEYDDAGRRKAVIQHNTVATSTGTVQRPTVSRTTYNGLGQVLFQLENADSPESINVRVTAYAYERDRLKKIGALLPGITDPDWQDSLENQITELKYEAQVIKPGHSAFSPANQNNAWVSEVKFPHATTGQPSSWDKLTFTYFTDGRVATRTDQRGVKFKYSYDVPGNLTKIDVDDLPPTGTPSSPPPDTIDLVEFVYDTLGNPKEVKAKTNSGADWVAHNKLDYDSRGNLTEEVQSHGAAATTSSPKVQYEWSYSAAVTNSQSTDDGNNFDRLTQMLYPKRIQAPTIQRELDMVYGASVTARDSILGRITQIGDNRLGEAARYQYAGTSRRVSQQYGYDTSTQQAPVSQTYASSSTVGYPGLDQYGRVKDLHFKNADTSNSTLQRIQYGYDPIDQRLFARTTQRSSSGTAVDNERSWLYTYDRLGRLVTSKHGALDSTNTDVGTSTSVPTVRDSLWTMDLLGNWIGDSQNSLPGRRTLGVPQTTGPPTREVSFTDTVNRTNAISQRQKKDGSTTTNSTLVHDRAGNLVLDELYHYRYDAWNRLALVTERGTLAASLNPSNGQLAWSGDAGAWIVHYTYDGLGRLIRKQSPWPDLDPWNRPQVRTEHFYYDGVRRIQETVTDPLPTDSYDPIQVKEEMESPPPASTTSVTTREYIHSPGYVDELVAEVDIAASSTGSPPDRPAWVIQDANYNLAALIDDSGAMLHQYTWDPYGQPVHIDRYDTGTGGAPQPFENRIGHQGLFFDRFDGGTQNVLLKQLEVDAATGLACRGLYQNRNRSYSPHLGRFVQRDPNGSGSALIGSPLSHGGVGRLLAGGPQLDVVYGNGANLFALTGGAPTFRVDPMGLEWQWDFEGVVLPLVMNVLDGALPISMLSPFDALLEGYRNLRTLKNRVNREIQQRMYDREEEADWAVDWSRPDNEYGPQTSNPVVYNDVESPFGPLASLNSRYPSKAVSNGKTAEAAARGSGKMRMGRKTNEGPLETSQRTSEGWRFYDGVDPGNPRIMIEVKIGSQGVTERIRRQIIKDKTLMQSSNKQVKWILYERDGHPINPDLVKELKHNGIPWEPAKLVH